MRRSGALTAEDMRAVDAGGPMPDENAPLSPSAEAALRSLASSVDAKPHYSPVVMAGLVRCGEFALTAAVGALIYMIHVVPGEGFSSAYLAVIPAAAVLAVTTFQVLHLYTISAFRSPVRHGLRLLTAWTCVFLAVTAVVYFLKLDVPLSRLWLFGWYACGLLVLLAGRVGLRILTAHLGRSGRLERRTVIVGGGASGEKLLQELAAQKDTDLKIYGVFDDRSDARSPASVAGYPKLGNIDDLVAIARHIRIDLIIFTVPISAEQRLLQMLRKLWVLPIDIRLAAHSNKLKFRPRSYSYIGSVPVLDVFDKPIADWDVLMKAVFDRVVGTLALIALSPIMVLTAIAVKLDSPGPIFFKQKRHGFNNEAIDVFKFRSMYVNQLDFTASRQVTRGDPRVTRVGRFIRKTSIDELPQLLNVVFKGNLSLVGPRPHALHAKAADRQYDAVVDGYFARHRVKPGITGWAQVNGWRGETDTSEKIQRRVELDLAYIGNWSLLFDFYILLVTPLALSKTENAY